MEGRQILGLWTRSGYNNGLTHAGEGVGRQRMLFCPRYSAGDRILAEIVNIKRNYARGRLLEVLDSPLPGVSLPAPVTAPAAAASSSILSTQSS